MQGLRLGRVVTSTALALAMALTGGASGILASTDTSAIEAGTTEPRPDASRVPITEVTPSPQAAPDPSAAGPTADEGIPLPEPATVPPPTARDIENPTLPSLNAADIPVVEKLRNLVSSKALEHIIGRKRERDAVVAFYAARNFAPLWIENGVANERAAAAMAHLKTADADGLDPGDYATPEIGMGVDSSALAEAELRLTGAALTYARHAQSGRVHFSRVHSDISYNLAILDLADVLAKIDENKSVGETLASYHPPHAGYKALKAKLATLRATAGEHEAVRILDGPIMHLGMDDPRVPLLRKRLMIPGDEASTIFDKAVSEAVKTFQTKTGIPADGLVGPQTLRAMNGSHRGRDIDIIIANMERWRWMPRDFGISYSILNIPDFSMKVVRDGATVWQTKVVVGKRSTPTPILSDTMKFITVNPTWNVPPSIMNNEYLPALRQDPTVLDRMGIKVVRNRDGSIRMYQPPGDGNALGRLRFNFPNKFLVYQHDTPDKHLFNRAVRAYSNGCMRLQDPLKYAEILLSIALPKARYTQERLRKMYGGAERNISFPTPIPVHLTYQTAFVSDSGELVIRDDIYHYDERILDILRGEDRRVADIAVPNPHRHAADPGPSGPRLVGSRRDTQETSGVPSFFERLFR